MDGLLHRCECFLVNHNLPFLEKVWIADRYKLNRLLILCLREMRPNSKIDLTGSRYYALSDRVKEIAEPPLDLEMFQRQSDLFFSAIRAKTGRVYHVNPYYMAAWSNVFQERVYCSSSSVEEIFCPCSHEELKAFLMAIHPPQLRLNDDCLSTRARAAMLDRLAVLLDEPGMQPHHCARCKATSTCTSVTWMCPQCKTYSTDPNLLRHPQNAQQSSTR
ncbi:unnamed protein product [Haemonchus placei]|uniref:BTB domain-containing protein n=1 Tax=Haemonchus placei TaxID=6290 RepID=A0A0N4X874_HAEPC|nr:unnamed protein product [Haemonchus placei]